MKTKFLTLLVASIFILGSTVQPAKAGGDGEVFGTLIGAAVGGLVGSNVGKGKGQLAATAIGVLFGAGIGNSIGNSHDQAGQITNTVYSPQPRVIYQPTPQPRVIKKVIYVERPKTITRTVVRERVGFIKQKPRHSRKYNKRKYWQKRHKHDSRRVYYSRDQYENTRYVSHRRNRS